MNDASSKPEAAADAETRADTHNRYRGTLLLFAVVAAALVFWFQRHVEPFVTETLIIGGTMSLWGLWKLGWSMYEDAAGEGGSDLTRKVLGGRGALRALAFAAIIVLFLHVWTSSIYLRYGGASPGEGAFKVQILEGDKVFMGPFDIGPGRTVGYPMFPRFRTQQLSYDIISPRGYLPEQAAFAPWSAHDYTVPGDFKRKELHLLRFVPGVALYSDLPRHGESGGERYYLEMRARGQSVTLADFSRGIVVTGVTAPDLPDPFAVARDATVRQELNDHFARPEVDNPGSIVATLMDSPLNLLASVELAAGDAVEVEIGVLDGADARQNRKPKVTCHVRVPATTSGRHTFIVGPGEGECK